MECTLQTAGPGKEQDSKWIGPQIVHQMRYWQCSMAQVAVQSFTQLIAKVQSPAPTRISAQEIGFAHSRRSMRTESKQHEKIIK